MNKITALLSALCLVVSANAAQYRLPSNGGSIVGQAKSATARRGDTLDRLAIRYGVGYNEMAKANRKWSGRKIPSGTTVTIPTRHKLPSARRSGVVINLADLRLYYYPPGSGVVHTFPVAVGKSGWSTPRGRTSIIRKHKHPTWTPPKSIRREAAKRGRKLRAVYQAGPNNPLGTRALRLGLPGYLIHGTNKPWSIGRRVSHGCIRMRRHDIESLFNLVSVNTPVTIVSQGTSVNYTPNGTARSVGKSKSSYSKKQSRKRKYSSSRANKSQARKGTMRKQSAKKRYQRRKPAASTPYVSNRGFDMGRFNRDMKNGTSNAIPLD